LGLKPHLLRPNIFGGRLKSSTSPPHSLLIPSWEGLGVYWVGGELALGWGIDF